MGPSFPMSHYKLFSATDSNLHRNLFLLRYPLTTNWWRLQRLLRTCRYTSSTTHLASRSPRYSSVILISLRLFSFSVPSHPTQKIIRISVRLNSTTAISIFLLKKTDNLMYIVARQLLCRTTPLFPHALLHSKTTNTRCTNGLISQV